MRFLVPLLMLALPVFAADVMPITPATAGSKTISCTSSSAATALPTAAVGMTQLELQNAGTVYIFVEVGTSTVSAAVATGYPVGPSQDKVITIPPTTTHVACIVSATTTTLYATIGQGN